MHLQILELLKHRSRYHGELIFRQEKLPQFVVDAIESVINREEFVVFHP